MALRAPTSNASSNNRTAQPNLEPGTYPARIVRVLDLGLQPQRPFKGEAKAPAHMINVTYELVDVFMLDEQGKELEDKPRWISEEFPLHSMIAELAKSTKRYKAIDPDNEHGGDWSAVLGAACMVTTVQTTSAANGRTYDNVANVTQARSRDASKMAWLQNAAVFFDLSEPDLDVFKMLPSWQQEKIQGNLEYAGSPLERALAGEGSQKKKPAEQPAQKAPKNEAKQSVELDDDETIPW